MKTMNMHLPTLIPPLSPLLANHHHNRHQQSGPWGDALITLHHASAYQQGMCHLLATGVAPALQSMASLSWQQEVQAGQLREQNGALKVREEDGGRP